MAGHEQVRHYVATGKHGAVVPLDVGQHEAWLDYTCGHCNTAVHGCVIASAGTPDGQNRWLLCPRCGKPSVGLVFGLVIPGGSEGPNVQGLPKDVATAYEEARRALGSGCFTASELMCRKILMHIAVDLTPAGPGETFAAYISALESAGFVTPPMGPWVDQIRKNGNEAAHELPQITKERATGTLMFTAELLRLSYEMEHLRAQFAPSDLEGSDDQSSTPSSE